MAFLGLAANIAQLLGGGSLFELITMIEKAARMVCRNEEACRQISALASMTRDRLQQLQHASRFFEHPELWKPTQGLKDTLRRAYRLIAACQHSSYAYKFCCGSDIADALELMRTELGDWNKHLTRVRKDILLDALTQLAVAGLHANRHTIKQDGALALLAGSSASHLDNNNGRKLIDGFGQFRLLAEPEEYLPAGTAEEFSIKNQLSRYCCWCPNISYKGTGLTKFSFSQLKHATNQFSLANKIGFGGSSYVYKGQLKTGLQVAVKRASYEGKIPFNHFENEIGLIPKVEHTNIVKLLGYCNQKTERILVFEYMPNGSLDSFIYGERAREALEWPKRHQIIEGVAQGATYLQQLCDPRIIHGDLKPGNILLDSDFKPKICDFGISKALNPDSDEHCDDGTIVAGSRGFIAPEYIGRGCLSIKSDVYSFGVTILQIISRKRFPPPPLALSDISRDYGPLNKWAWDLCVAGRLLEFIDPSLHGEPQNAEILRWVQIALLCVQENPEDRPTMSEVHLMLSSEDDILKQPNQPAYYY